MTSVRRAGSVHRSSRCATDADSAEEGGGGAPAGAGNRHKITLGCDRRSARVQRCGTSYCEWYNRSRCVRAHRHQLDVVLAGDRRGDSAGRNRDRTDEVERALYEAKLRACRYFARHELSLANTRLKMCAALDDGCLVTLRERFCTGDLASDTDYGSIRGEPR